MRCLLLVTILLCLNAPIDLSAQSRDLPIAALLEIDRREGPSLTGRLLEKRADTLLIQVDGQAAPDLVPMATVSKIRVKQSAPVWVTSLGEKIEWFRLVSVPPEEGGLLPRRWLLTFGKETIRALDPGTGEQLWRLDGVPKPHEAYFALLDGLGPYAVLTLESDDLTCLDLTTGEREWTLDDLPFKDWEGGFYTLDDHVLVLYGKTEESDGTMLAVSTETGELIWRQDSLFVERPRSSWGNQSTWMYRDSTLMLYASKDGPVALDMMSGQLKWRATALQGRDVPASGWYSRMYIDDELMLTPSEKGILAIDPNDGRAVWDSIARLRSRPLQMSITDHGLLVRGADPDDKGRFNKGEYVTLLDLETGLPLWAEEFRELDNTTSYTVRGDTAYLAADEKLVAIYIPTGEYQVIRAFEFQGGEEPGRLYVSNQGFELVSAHNLLSLDSLGRLRYQKYYEKPGTSLGEVLTRTVLPILLQATVEAATNTYIYSDPTVPIYRPGATMSAQRYYAYTGGPTLSGLEGFSLVKVAVDSATEEGRIWFDERNPDFLLDGASGSVFVAKDDQLRSYRFMDWTSLADVARTDNVAMLDTLVRRGLDPATTSEMGMTALMAAARMGAEEMIARLIDLGQDVNAATEGGWTPLMYAAESGQLSTVRLLVERGARVDQTATVQGWDWSAWHLALREGHDSVAALLVNRGADTSVAEEQLMRSWATAEDGRPLEALALLDSASAADSTLQPPPSLWLLLCVQGALWEAAEAVLPACAEAIDGDSTEVTGWHARGIARAIAGDLTGAIEDFEAAVARRPEVALENTLRRWIRTLREGQSPFQPYVIAHMRDPRG